MEQKLDVESVAVVVIVVSVVLLILLSIFTFGFCMPVMDDFKTQLEILEHRDCVVSQQEYYEWRKMYDGE